MHKIDPELCTACGSCLEECPEDAITEGDDFYTITDACIDCGSVWKFVRWMPSPKASSKVISKSWFLKGQRGLPPSLTFFI